MSGLFKSKETETPASTQMIYDPYAGVRGKLSSWLEGKIGQSAKPYTGQLTAPMSDQEKKSLGYLDEYANQGQSETTKLASGEINKTLSGNYDPSTSPYYQAVKAQSVKNLEDSNERLKQQASMGGRYFGGGRVKAQADLEGDVTRGLNTMLGQLSENERQRRIDILPQAMQSGQYQEMEPLRKTEALQTYGSLPRAIQQSLLDSLYNEFVSSERDYPISIANAASGMATARPDYEYTPTQRTSQSSPWGPIAQSAISAALPAIFSMI